MKIESKHRWAIGLIMVLSLTTSNSLVAQEASKEKGQAASASEEKTNDVASPSFKQALTKANKAYNDGDYPQAVQFYTQAIQLDPRQDAPYRNVARAYFWGNKYSAALAYYDLYLTTFPLAKDVEQIQRERKLTSERAKKPWQLPEAQRQAMRKLESMFEQGTIYQSGGNGAWAAYQILLRTGYAQPNLKALRERLVRELLNEFDKKIATEEAKPAPDVSLEEWKLQQARLDAAKKVALEEATMTVIKRREQITEAALAMHFGRYPDAASLAQGAFESNPEVLWLLWLKATAQFRASQLGEVSGTLDALESLLKQRDAKQLPYISAMRAMVEQHQGRQKAAAKQYIDFLMRP